MPGFEFHFEGLDDLAADLEKVITKYPDAAEKVVYSLAGKFTKDVNTKLEAVEKGHSKHPIATSWHRSRAYGGVGGGQVVAVEINNSAPHWHLVENGHEVYGNPKMAAAYLAGALDPKQRKSKRRYKKGGGKGTVHLGTWKPGHQVCAKTRDEWDGGVFHDHVAQWTNKMLKEHNL